MKKKEARTIISASVGLRVVIAIALFINLLAYPMLGTSSVAPTSFAASINLRSESQIRGEAARYERALSELSKILTMKLETKNDLTQAHALFEREHANLKFLLSKLFVTAISDSTFSDAVKKRVTDQNSAQDFARELGRDPNSILKLNGAASLKTQLVQAPEADAATLRKIADRLKQAAEKIGKTNARANDSETSDGFKLIRASFTSARPSTATPRNTSFLKSDRGEVVVDLLITVAIVVLSGPAVVAAIVLAAPISTLIAAELAINVVAIIIQIFGTQQGQDDLSKCLDAVEARRNSCESAAIGNLLAPVINAACVAQWLLDAALCEINR